MEAVVDGFQRSSGHPERPGRLRILIMQRALVWLENATFAAWACRACNWILPGSRPTLSGTPPTEVQEAFDNHDCARFARRQAETPVIHRPLKISASGAGTAGGSALLCSILNSLAPGLWCIMSPA